MTKSPLSRLLSAAAISAAAAASAHAGILGPGSIAFTGLNADGLDDFSFVALQTIPTGTIIGFTDNEWNGAGWADSNENGFEWTATSDVAAGTIVHLRNVTNVSAGSPAASSNLGTLAATAGAGTNTGIGNSDEAIYAYIGSFAAPTAFLALIANETSALLTTVSLVGTGLIEGSTAFFLGGDEDILEYTGARNDQASFSAYLTQLATPANWISQDGSGDQSIDATVPNVPFSSEPFTLIPTPGAAALLALGGLVSLRRRR